MWRILQLIYGAVALGFWFVSCCTVGSFSVVYFSSFGFSTVHLVFFGRWVLRQPRGPSPPGNLYLVRRNGQAVQVNMLSLIPKSSHTRRWELRHARSSRITVYVCFPACRDINSSNFGGQVPNLKFEFLVAMVHHFSSVMSKTADHATVLLARSCHEFFACNIISSFGYCHCQMEEGTRVLCSTK